MKHRNEEEDYKTAAYIADKIVWDNVEDINLLVFVSTIYEKNKDFKRAREILEKAYKVAPIKNRLYFPLCIICIKNKDLKAARNYYIDFCNSFKEDPRKHLLKYYYLKGKGAEVDQQIRVLEEYTEEEKDEEMLFELAILYDRLGNKEKVIQICDYIVDFFGVKIKGYGRDALLLKKKYEKLSVYETGLLLDNEYSKENLDDEKEAYNYNTGENDRLVAINRAEDKNKEIEDIKEKVEKVETINREENEIKNEERQDFPYKVDIDNYQPTDKELAFLNNEDGEKKKKIKQMIENIKRGNEKEEEKTAFIEFRERSFVRKRRLNTMHIDELKLHMIIEAYSKEEGIDIAKEELDYIHRAKGEKVSMVKVSAYNMNDKGFDYYIQKLGGRDMIIESAGRLKEQLIDDIEEFMLNKRNKNIVVLVDVINNFDRLAQKRPSFLDRFDIYSVVSPKRQEKLEMGESKKEIEPSVNMSESDKKIINREIEEIKENIKKVEKIVDDKEERKKDNIPIERNEHLIQKALEAKRNGSRDDKKENISRKDKEQVEKNTTREMQIDEFVEYCKNYAKSIDCVMPGKTIPALYEAVEEMVEGGMKLTEENAVNLMEEAADRAEKPRLFSKPKYDKEGCLILSEEHFI